MYRKTLLALSLCVSTSVLAQSQLIFEEELSNGVDGAVVSAFTKAASSVSIGNIGSVDAKTASEAVQSARIVNHKIEITFSEEKLESALSKTGAVSWKGLDDPVMVWIAEANTNQIVGGDSINDFCKALSASATADKFQIIYPILDIDDIQAVNVQTVLTHSDAQLATATKRYGSQFFVAGAIETATDGAVTFKWNVYDAEGKHLGGDQVASDSENAAKTAADGIAKTLMENTTGATVQDNGADVVTASSSNALDLGPGDGFVRVLVTGTQNVRDFSSIRSTLITYGYESDIKVVAYTKGGVVMQIPTGASSSILDGTMAHAGEFTKIADWTYAYNRSSGIAPSNRGGVGVGENIITSDILKNATVATASGDADEATTVHEAVPMPKAGADLVDDSL